MALTFTVLGEPKPKGSFRAYTYKRKPEKGGGFGARATNDNPATTSWQNRIAFEATTAQRRGGVQLVLAGGIEIQVTFYLPRPKSLSKSYAGPHLKKPDLDKLQRALLDALKGVLYEDDSQVVFMEAWKFYAAIGTEPRAEITVVPVALASPARPLFERTAPDGR